MNNTILAAAIVGCLMLAFGANYISSNLSVTRNKSNVDSSKEQMKRLGAQAAFVKKSQQEIAANLKDCMNEVVEIRIPSAYMALYQYDIVSNSIMEFEFQAFGRSTHKLVMNKVDILQELVEEISKIERKLDKNTRDVLRNLDFKDHLTCVVDRTTLAPEWS